MCPSPFLYPRASTRESCQCPSICVNVPCQCLYPRASNRGSHLCPILCSCPVSVSTVYGYPSICVHVPCQYLLSMCVRVSVFMPRVSVYCQWVSEYLYPCHAVSGATLESEPCRRTGSGAVSHSDRLARHTAPAPAPARTAERHRTRPVSAGPAGGLCRGSGTVPRANQARRRQLGIPRAPAGHRRPRPRHGAASQVGRRRRGLRCAPPHTASRLHWSAPLATGVN